MELQSKSQQPVRVLLVDDDEEDYLIIRRLFSSMKGLEARLEWVSSSDEAIETIKESRHDAYFIDYRLDALTGLDVLQEVNAAERYEPFILLTGMSDQGIERESLHLAASDYLVKKNLTSDSLSRALYYALGRKEQEKQKIEQLIELNRTKDEFISIASHQLRTPATTVKQYVAMALDGMAGPLGPKQQELLQKAYESNERQLAIINTLLKVAQIDAGGMELARKEVSLSALLNQAAEEFCPIFQSADQILETSFHAGLTAYIDENAVRMVLDNLLENAKKYSKPGSTTRIVAEKKGIMVEITIEDQGVGVDKPDKLFKKFSRIDNELSTVVDGTGLGLYWARSIAQMHDGDLRYEKNRPKGSKFILELPIM
jgi:two-component system sensor histidine kinase/response regulator